MICLSVLEYKAGDALLSVRCQKDCRHGHGKKRLGYHYHRWDGYLPGGEHIKLTWDGIGVMTPEMARARAEAKNRPPQKQGKNDWIRGVADDQ